MYGRFLFGSLWNYWDAGWSPAEYFCPSPVPQAEFAAPSVDDDSRPADRPLQPPSGYG